MPCRVGRGAACWLLCLGLMIARSPRLAAQEPAPPAGRGAITGDVVDAATARPIVGATVQIEGQPAMRKRTDVSGRFRLFVAPGTYQVRISAPAYGVTTLRDVTVDAGATVRADASLKPEPRRTAGKSGVEVLEVTADVTESTEATQLLKRKMAPTVGDSLGADAISKTPDSDAAEVVTRVPAVTIKDNKFIIVRGLGERYSSALLNGSRLPSTDPNRRIVPLDIFPADFIESLTIVKTYTPDLPGDFSGGLVDIRIAEPPTRLTYGASLSLGFNTETTFQDFDTYDGYAGDWFTLGDGPRSLPDIFDQVFPSNGSTAPSTTQMRALVNSLPDNWNITSTTAPPNLGFNASVGNSWGPFGFNLAAVYGWKFSARRDEVVNGFGSEQEIENPSTAELFQYDDSTFETQLGSVLSMQYALSTEHKLLARALVNRQGIDQVLKGRGVDGQFDAETTQLPAGSFYTTNQLGFGALEGLHHFSLLDIDWRASWAPSSQEVPDSKYYVYIQSPEVPVPELGVSGLSQILEPQRTWSTLSEFLQDYYVDATVPFRTRLPFTDVWRGLPAQFKTGANLALRDRSFLFQSYRISGNNPQDQLDLTRQPDALLIPPNFSDTGPLLFDLLERQPFDASQEIIAGYGMFDLPLIEDRLRLIAGARLEYSYLTTSGLLPTAGTVQSRLNDLDPLPSVSLVYTPRDDMNIRGVFSETVSRPEFRELTPTQFTTLPGERRLQGNPFLVTSNITNYDLRWEWFLSPLELVSLGFFYKELENPIELVTAVETSALVDTFVNYDQASLWGFEIETRKDFNFAVPYARRVSWLRPIAAHLADLQLLINASVIESETSEEFTAPPGFTIAPVPGTQPLQGQSPFVINAALEYEDYRWGVFRLLYNTVGSTIVAKGVDVSPGSPTGVLPNIDSARRDQLDFVWLSEVSLFGTPFSTKFAVENILNDDFIETQGPRITNRYRTGVTFSTGISYSF